MPYKSDKQRRFMHAKHPRIVRRWDEEEKAVAKREPQPRYGGRGGYGRKIVDEDMPKGVEVNKAYDPEARRQRRLGAAEAALLLGGGAAVHRGTQGIMRTTRQARNAAKLAEKWKDSGTASALRRGVTASRKDMGYVGGGTASILGAGLVRQHAEGKRGRRWN